MGRTRGEKQRFISDLARAHDRIEPHTGGGVHSPTVHANAVNQNYGLRPETAGALPRSKSQNRHLHQGTTVCYPEEDGAEGKKFEVRVGKILKMRNSTAILNSSVIEAWINETLKDAEHLEIPGIIVKPVHKQPMSRYKIDKLYLHSQSVPIEDIERIYRSLFVYSIGFYEMILKCTQHAKNKYSILSSLWKVFQILLEYCCKSNY